MKPKDSPSIHICWDIIFACNLRCSYCFCSGKWEKLRPDNKIISADKWEKCWNRFYKRYGSADITISGGEPFCYPDFINIVKKLSKKHKIGICTNLSFDVGNFCKNITPDKVRLCPSFHIPLDATLEEALNCADFYIWKILYLRKNGFNTTVSFVGHPERLLYIDGLKKRFNSQKIDFLISPFLGKYKGKRYPDCYTKEERIFIRRIVDIGKESLSFQLDQTPTRGRFCRAGQLYFRIHPDGVLLRCSYEPLDGGRFNFITGEYSLYDAPKKCEQEFCYCVDEFRYVLDDKE